MIYLAISLSLIIGFGLSQVIFRGSGLMKKLNESEKNYRELAEKYEVEIRNLEKRIHEEVAKNREKDHILIQHSKLAAMGEMIASIGHQWRQPLNSLSLLVQDVREALEFDEVDHHYIDQFTRESMVQINQLSRTIHDFRKFYKMSNEKCAFSVADCIEEALSIFSINLKKHGIQVEFEYRGQQTAFGYPNEFSQVVLNILTNARDAFIENNCKERILKIKINESNEFINVEFIDNAGGIDPDVIGKVFDPYFTTKPHGTGLGLYMTKMILENMDGTVSMANSGDGTCLCLCVPKVRSTVKPQLVSV